MLEGKVEDDPGGGACVCVCTCVTVFVNRLVAGLAVTVVVEYLAVAKEAVSVGVESASRRIPKFRVTAKVVDIGLIVTSWVTAT